MVYSSFDTNLLIGSNLDATTNPDPNTLGVSYPYPNPFVDPRSPSPAWLNQGAKAILPLRLGDGLGNQPLKLNAIVSIPDSAFEMTLFFLNYLTQQWFTPSEGDSETIPGSRFIYLDRPGFDLIFIKFSNIENGAKISLYGDKNAVLAI